MGLCFLWFYKQELPKAQPAVVLVLKRLRRWSNGIKSHPTDWEKPGIEPATPGLQDIGLSPTPWRLLSATPIRYLPVNKILRKFELQDLHLCTQKTVCAANFGPFGEIGANFSLQLISQTQFAKLKKY